MRTLAVLPVIALILLALPTTLAQTEPIGLSHLEAGTLSPGQEHEFRLGMATDLPVDGGEFLFLSARVDGAAGSGVFFEVSVQGGPVLTNWSWDPNTGVHTQYVQLEEVENYYLLRVWAAGSNSGSVDYSFQYDISCDCETKDLALEGGLIVFHKDIRYEEVAHINFELEPDLEFELWAAIPEEQPGTFPHGWEVLDEGHREGVRMTLTYSNGEYVGPLYFFVQSETGTATIEPLYVLPPQTTAVIWLASIWIGLGLLFFGGLWLLSKRPAREGSEEE